MNFCCSILKGYPTYGLLFGLLGIIISFFLKAIIGDSFLFLMSFFLFVSFRQIHYGYYLCVDENNLFIINRIFPFIKYTFRKSDKYILSEDSVYYKKTLKIYLTTISKRSVFHLGYVPINLKEQIQEIT